MTGLAWLNDLMVWLAKWVPRFTLIKAGNEGVLFGPGGSVAKKYPGMCFYWPITHELTIVSTRSRSAELAAQLHNKEGISLVVLFKIVNTVDALLKMNDVFSQLDDRTQAHLATAYTATGSNRDIADAVLGGLRSEFGAFGVEIERVDVAQRGWVLPLKMLNDYAQRMTAKL